MRANVLAETSAQSEVVEEWISRADHDILEYGDTCDADDGAAISSVAESSEDSQDHQAEKASISKGTSSASSQTQKAVELRKIASKAVLNGGVGPLERNRRVKHIEEVAASQGVVAAQIATASFARQDEDRKKRRKAFLKQLKPYLERNARLVELEAEQEQLEIEERKTWTPEVLAEAGIMLSGLEGHWIKEAAVPSGKAKKKSKFATIPSRTAILQRPGKAKLGWTKLQQGHLVEMRDERTIGQNDSPELTESNDDAAKHQPAIATIHSIDEHEIRLTFKEPVPDFDIIECPAWRIDLAYNDTIKGRLHTSIQALSHDVAATSRAGTVLSGTYLVDVLLDETAPKSADELKNKDLPVPIYQWIKDNDTSAPAPDMSSLTKTQQKAVDLMLRNRISLIQGPPGTGKTSTIVAALRVLKQHYCIPHSILLTSHTNVAVDNLAQGCKDSGLNVVRAGQAVRVRESLSDVTLDGHMARHPSKARLDEINSFRIATLKALQLAQKQEVEGLSDEFDEVHDEDGEVWNLSNSEISSDLENSGAFASKLAKDGPEQLRRSLSQLIGQAHVLRRRMEADIFAEADVVCCTALSAPLLDSVDFPLVFFDEATMATEPITIAAMIKGCQQLSLIGDHKQLSPLIVSREAKQEGLGSSLFERLMARGDIESVMLDTQHRMHPALAAFPGKEFYEGSLSDGKATAEMDALRTSFSKEKLDSSAQVTNSGYLNFIHHSAHERLSRGNKSLENKGEAEIIVRVLADLLAQNPDLSGDQVGILTPYAGQKELLSRALLVDRSSPLRRLLLRELELRGGQAAKSRMSTVAQVEVETIDGFEGREKRVIIFSLTRSNRRRFLGFLNNCKRWNVALTRARNALYIVGNIDMLEKGPVPEKRRKTPSNDVAADLDLAADPTETQVFRESLQRVALIDDAAPPVEHEGFLARFAAHLRENNCIIGASELLVEKDKDNIL